MDSLLCCCLVGKSCPATLQLCGLKPARLISPWDFPGKNPGVGFHFLLQRIFPTQELNTSLALAGRFFATERPGKLGKFYRNSDFFCLGYGISINLFFFFFNGLKMKNITLANNRKQNDSKCHKHYFSVCMNVCVYINI